MVHRKTMKTAVAAIILAAGKGGRMGGPKLFLKIRRRCFWEWIVHNLKKAGLDDIAIVIRSEHRESFSAVQTPKPIINPRPSKGMFSSVKQGYGAMPGYAGYLICPVDHPLVAVRTYRRLVAGFRQTPFSVIRPWYRGKIGHPILIPDLVMKRMRKWREDGRLDAFLKESTVDFRDIRVSDANVLRNINIREDMKHVI